MKKVLIVEDDSKINNMLKEILSMEYKVTQAFSGSEALLVFEKNKFDLVILDYMLPGKSGEEVLSEIRSESSIAIIVLTAVSDNEKVVSLLNKGANDYIIKPFNVDVLKARIEVQLRSAVKERSKIHFKNMLIDLENKSLTVNNKNLDVTHKEFLIMEALIKNPNKIFTKDELYRKVWDDQYYGDENTINVHISNLRKKIKDGDPNEDYIKTIWGFGIQLCEGEIND